MYYRSRRRRRCARDHHNVAVPHCIAKLTFLQLQSRMANDNRTTFWADVWTLQGAVTTHIIGRVLVFGILSVFCVWLHQTGPAIALEVGPIEVAGGALILLLVLRSNAGYDRWWEGRKLWGGIVNQSRNLALGGLAYGPHDPQWRSNFVHWCISFSHVCRRSLRAERDAPEIMALLGQESAASVVNAHHMPAFVSGELARFLHHATQNMHMDRFAFIQLDRQRAQLLDHLGACERILKTPLPRVFVITIRRFLSLYLVLLPLGLIDRIGWFTPPLVMLTAYVLLGVDQIAAELESPFSKASLSHLPLDEICVGIEKTLLAALADDRVRVQPARLRRP